MPLTIPAGELAGLQSFTDTLRCAAREPLRAVLQDADVNERTATLAIDLDDAQALIDLVDDELRRPGGPLLDPDDAIAWGTFIGAHQQARTQPDFTAAELDDLFNILDWEIKYDEGAEPEDLERRRLMRARLAAAQEA
jgi:hypothetical protein